jgi:small GTP-binding protein
MTQNLSKNDIKLILIGNTATGKTSFANKWITNRFSTSYKATITSQYNYKIITKNNSTYRVQLWDLTGQDRNYLVTKLFSKNCHGVVILSEIANNDSLHDTLKWKEAIEQNEHIENLPFILIQNKSDLLSESNLKETQSEIERFASQHGFKGVFRTSAKNGDNVNEAMNFLIDCVLDNKNSGIVTNHKEGIVLDANNNSDKEESGGEGNFKRSVGNESDYNKEGWSCCG